MTTTKNKIKKELESNVTPKATVKETPPQLSDNRNPLLVALEFNGSVIEEAFTQKLTHNGITVTEDLYLKPDRVIRAFDEAHAATRGKLLKKIKILKQGVKNG